MIILCIILLIGFIFSSYSAVKRGIRLKKQGEDLDLIHVSINGSATMDIIVNIGCCLICLTVLILLIIKG